LLEIEPRESDSVGSHSATKLYTSAFNKGQEPHPSQDNLLKCFFARPARFPTPEHLLFAPESSLPPQSMDNRQLVQAENNRSAVKSGPQQHLTAKTGIGLPIGPFRAISPFRPGCRLQPLILAPEGHRMKLEPSSYRSSAGKIASNDKHKQSEKRRRDEMGAYVQAAEIVRASLHPGIFFNCPVCIQNMPFNDNACSSSSMPENVTPIAVGATFKKTKNQSIEEGLMWQFSTVLHLVREEVGSRLDGIRSLAGQMTLEKQCGRNNGAEVLMELLRKMRHVCELHDISPCACGKHEVGDWPTDDSCQLIMPPSSSLRTSPRAGLRRSRDTTEEEEKVDEKRRVRRRSMARL